MGTTAQNKLLISSIHLRYLLYSMINTRISQVEEQSKQKNLSISKIWSPFYWLNLSYNWKMAKSEQITTNCFGHEKTLEAICFRGFCTFWSVDYLLENCGARRAAFKPYSPDLDPKSPAFMRVFGLSSLSKPIGKPTKSRNFGAF